MIMHIVGLAGLRSRITFRVACAKLVKDTQILGIPGIQQGSALADDCLAFLLFFIHCLVI
jgi:hypothetical protein